MDEQELQAKIAEAKAAGYTDEEIQAHLNELHGTAKPLEAPEQNKHHEANVGTAQAGVAALGGPAVDLAIKGAEIAGAGYGLKKLAVDPIMRAIQQAGPNARTVSPNGDVFRGGQPSFNNAGQGIKVNPVAPSQGPSNGFDAGGQKVADFVNQRGQFAPEAGAPSAEAQAYQRAAQEAAARQAVAQPPTAANFLQRVGQLATRYAPVARGAAGAGLMAYSPNLGPQVPTAGPARGAEINPATGRPWTEFELARYNQQY